VERASGESSAGKRCGARFKRLRTTISGSYFRPASGQNFGEGDTEETAASLVGAGMASVLLFPIIALTLRRTAEPRSDSQSVVATPEKVA
jgi:hypothetical protein